MATQLQRTLLAHLSAMVSPITSIASADDLTARLNAIGWDLDALAGIDVAGLVQAASGLARAAESVLNDLGTTDDLSGYAEAAGKLGTSVSGFYDVVSSWQPVGGLPPDTPAILIGDVAGSLLHGYLATTAPRLLAVLKLVGVIEDVSASQLARGDGRVVRRAMPRPVVDLEVLKESVTDPLGLLARRFRDDPGGARRSADLIADLAGPLVADMLVNLGATAGYGLPGPGAGLGLTAAELDAARRTLVIMATPEAPDAVAFFRLAAGVTDDTSGKGLGLVLASSGELSLRAGDFRLRVEGEAGPLLVTGSGATFPGGPAAARLEVIASYEPHAVPFLLFGSAKGTHFQVTGLKILAGVAFSDGPPDLRAGLELSGIELAVSAGDGDGFLQRTLPAAPLVARADVGADWSMRQGLRFRGAARFEVRLPTKVTLGPIELRGTVLAADVTADGITVVAAVVAAAALGPVRAVVEEVGLAAALTPDGRTGVTFKPPKGVGLSIAAGPVSGGGYLFLDPAKGEYAGVLELSVKVVSLKAIGLLTTKLPDGRPGFSLLLIITAEFPPIQLGFGFTLLGVGGLLGVNRTVAVGPLRDGVRTRALDAVLFPKNPVADAPQLIGALRTLFPPAEARYTFGPMVKLGWGPRQLLEIELALILELPSPLRLVVAGRMRLRLPDEKAPVVVLRLDVVGILDLDRGEVSIDASLVDSRIAAFTICGDMAMRVGWKGTTEFALAVGGFHPRFAPPPGFPVLKRLAISLGEGDNPRIRLEAYLAVTSNTIQFGARLDLFVAAGPFSAAAYAGLDALVQFSPFHFTVSLSMGIDVSWGKTPILHAQLEANLEGPSPWHAYGHLEFGILFLKASIAVDITVGEAVAAEPPRVDLTDVLLPAIEAEDAWTTEPPPSATTGVSLRLGEPASGPVMNPLGRFTLRQRALPLATSISRYGAAVPMPNTATRFDIAALAVGRIRLVDPPAVHDGFAAAQFAELSDDQRLSRPAFEQMPSGVSAAVAAHRWPEDGAGSPVAQTADIVYDEAVVDDIDAPTPTPTPGPLDSGLAGLLVAGGAASRSAAREAQAIRGPDQRIEVVGEGYVAVPSGSLPTTLPSVPVSYAQAADARGKGQLVTAGEVTQ